MIYNYLLKYMWFEILDAYLGFNLWKMLGLFYIIGVISGRL